MVVKKTNCTYLCKLSVFTSVLLILIYIFRWDLVEILTPFLEPFVELFFHLLFIIVLTWSLLHFFRKYKNEKNRALYPLIINLITLFIILFVPFTNIVINIDFYIHLDERNKIVQMVESEELIPNVNYNKSLIILPKQYRNLSKGGGEVVIKKDGESLQILFYTFRGVLSNYSGFIYTSNGISPNDNLLFGTEFNQVIKYNEHWYWVSSS